MKALIIGGGLGGLLTAARLVREGHRVEIFERMALIGGRFINLEYKGYTLTSGALHMIPHGSRGPLASMLRHVGADVKIVTSSPPAMIRIPDNGGFRDLSFENFSSPLSLPDKLKLFYLTAKSRFGKPGDESFKDWFFPFIKDPWLIKFANAFCGWALSLRCDEVPAREVLTIIDNLRRYGGPGVPIGGCSAVIDALEHVILSGGGIIHTNSQVDQILIVDGRAVGVEACGETILGDVVISDIGHQATAQLFDHPGTDEFREYIALFESLKPSAGIKISVGADQPLIGHSGALLTPYTRRINGINEVTSIDPSLAPPGKHLVMSHQALQSDDIPTEIELGLKDLEDIFHGDDYEVLMVQSYRDGWPVNRTGSGSDPGNTTPIRGLYIVGDGAKGTGGVEVEGVALGVENTITLLQNFKTNYPR
jgi:phytoene dehydrogenase-like protein